MVAEIETAGFPSVFATLGDEGVRVLDAVAPILESIPNVGVQTTISAILVGVAWAAVEGEPTEYERDHATFITAEDRLKLWIAYMWASYREALKVRADPDCPNPNPKRSRM
jgi:hypothetical protein